MGKQVKYPDKLTKETSKGKYAYTQHQDTQNACNNYLAYRVIGFIF